MGGISADMQSGGGEAFLRRYAIRWGGGIIAQTCNLILNAYLGRIPLGRESIYDGSVTLQLKKTEGGEDGICCLVGLHVRRLCISLYRS